MYRDNAAPNFDVYYLHNIHVYVRVYNIVQKSYSGYIPILIYKLVFLYPYFYGVLYNT